MNVIVIGDFFVIVFTKLRNLFQQFDISDVVRNMRLQRQGMVQTEVRCDLHFFWRERHTVIILNLFFFFIFQDQYIFCYQVVLYVLRCLQAEENISG